MGRVIDGMRDFVDHPDCETEYAARIIREVDLLEEVSDRICNEPEFYAGFELDPELNEKTLTLMNVDFLDIVDELVKEIARRSDDPDFEIDQTSYEAMEKSMRRAAECKKVNRSFCDPEECFWCACRNRRKPARRSRSKYLVDRFGKTVGSSPPKRVAQ